MQEQRVIRRSRTNGISCGSIKERAETERVHPATLCRYDRLVSTTWSVTSKPERKEKMSILKTHSVIFFHRTIIYAGRATSAAIMVFHSVLVLYSSGGAASFDGRNS